MIVLQLGAIVGAVIGLFHAVYIYRRRASDFPDALAARPIATRAGALYYALWTFALWVLFGSYVFVLWMISVVVYGVYLAVKAVTPGARPAREAMRAGR